MLLIVLLLLFIIRSIGLRWVHIYWSWQRTATLSVQGNQIFSSKSACLLIIGVWAKHCIFTDLRLMTVHFENRASISRNLIHKKLRINGMSIGILLAHERLGTSCIRLLLALHLLQQVTLRTYFTAIAVSRVFWLVWRGVLPIAIVCRTSWRLV